MAKTITLPPVSILGLPGEEAEEEGSKVIVEPKQTPGRAHFSNPTRGTEEKLQLDCKRQHGTGQQPFPACTHAHTHMLTH